LILQLSQGHFANRRETQDRFEQILAELRRDRELQERKWEAQVSEAEAARKAQAEKWEAQAREADADRKAMRVFQEEQARKWDEQNQKWNEQNQRWDEQKDQWAEHRREFDRMHEAIMAIANKHDRSIGALGARWGMQTEAAFRNALAGILEKSFGVQVVHVTEYDDEGEVFGRPDQVELDVIIKNGLLILCEIKSSVSKSDMYSFERKVRFYEKRHGRTVDRMMVISPMVDKRAMDVAARLGIETYSDADEVEPDDLME